MVGSESFWLSVGINVISIASGVAVLYGRIVKSETLIKVIRSDCTRRQQQHADHYQNAEKIATCTAKLAGKVDTLASRVDEVSHRIDRHEARASHA